MEPPSSPAARLEKILSRLSAEHGAEIRRLPEAALRLKVAEEVLRCAYSPRQTRQLVNGMLRLTSFPSSWTAPVPDAAPAVIGLDYRDGFDDGLRLVPGLPGWIARWLRRPLATLSRFFFHDPIRRDSVDSRRSR